MAPKPAPKISKICETCRNSFSVPTYRPNPRFCSAVCRDQGNKNTFQDLLLKIVLQEPGALATGCWEWSGRHSWDGYGLVHYEGRGRYVHRLFYEHFVSKIPTGHDLDHLCRNHGCCNPEHLEPVTRFENLVRGDTFVARNVTRTHCPQGHPYNEENTHYKLRSGKWISRNCRVCDRERQARKRRRRSQAVDEIVPEI